MGTWILAAALYGLLAAACVGLYKTLGYNRKNAWRVPVVAALTGIVLINGVAWLTTEDTKAPGISTADIARTFGLETDKPYLATTYNVDSEAARFTIHGFADTKNGRVLNVDFVSGGIAHPIALPAGKVIVEQNRTLPAEMSVMIDRDTVGDYGKKRLAAPAPCAVQFKGIITCHRTPTYVTDPRDDLLLDDVLQGEIKRVAIRISPYMYNQLL